MIADERADAFVSNFTGQWLQLRNLEGLSAAITYLDRARLQGLDEGVNFVNAPVLAKERGLSVLESRDDEDPIFQNAVSVRATCDGGETHTGGSPRRPRRNPEFSRAGPVAAAARPARWRRGPARWCPAPSRGSPRCRRRP